MRTLMGLNEKDMVAVEDHGPSQVKRPASRPICVCKHSRALFDPEVSSAWIPFVSSASATEPGAKMNARSLELPSPLMSPATIGVYRIPERNWPNQLTRRKSKKLYPRL